MSFQFISALLLPSGWIPVQFINIYKVFFFGHLLGNNTAIVQFVETTGTLVAGTSTCTYIGTTG